MEMRLAQCLLVAKVLVADGIVTADERTFLRATMARLGLTEDEKKRVSDLEGWDEAEAVVATLSEDEKREFVDLLLTATIADGKMGAHEIASVKKISTALGLE